MNKSESKYFATAARMDDAFLQLLGEKDFEYITVKEICHRAGVNRSTFYLHYETVSDLLAESAEHMVKQFLEYFKHNTQTFMSKMHTCPLEELYLITPEYLTPYLRYVSDNRRLFRTTIEKADELRMSDSYKDMFRYIFTPILERFNVPDEDRSYIMAFYLNGIMAVINEWIKDDCRDSIKHVIKIMQLCIARPRTER